MLTPRDPNRIYLYQLETVGLYFYYWCARGGGEVNQQLGSRVVPSAWWFLVPFFGAYWWMWQYASALDDVSKHQIKKSDIFLLFVVVCNIGLPGLRVLNVFPYGWFRNLRLDVILIAIVLIAAWMSFAFFCSFVQKKINRLAAVAGSPPTAASVN